MNWRNFRTTAEHLWDRDLTNRKPYRKAAYKADAKKIAKKVDGRWMAPTVMTRMPVS